jgi:hypothetical protein
MMSKLKQDDVDKDILDEALEDSFPASDPPSMTQPKSRAGAPDGKKTPDGEAKKRETDEDTAAPARSGGKKS